MYSSSPLSVSAQREAEEAHQSLEEGELSLLARSSSLPTSEDGTPTRSSPRKLERERDLERQLRALTSFSATDVIAAQSSNLGFSHASHTPAERTIDLSQAWSPFDTSGLLPSSLPSLPSVASHSSLRSMGGNSASGASAARSEDYNRRPATGAGGAGGIGGTDSMQVRRVQR